jgi:hypothetical protein
MPTEPVFESSASGPMVGRCPECADTRFLADGEMWRLGDEIGQRASIRTQLYSHWMQKHLYREELQKCIDEYKSKAGAAAQPPIVHDWSIEND